MHLIRSMPVISEPHLVLETLISAGNRLLGPSAVPSGAPTTAATARTLSILATDGPLCADELAAAGRTSPAALIKHLRNLTADELVYRIADVDDSRAWRIAVTAKGANALLGWRRDLAEAVAPLLDDITDDDWKAVETTVALLDSSRRREAVLV
jgi:DNA-binding MarR family transcriptional regulator